MTLKDFIGMNHWNLQIGMDIHGEYYASFYGVDEKDEIILRSITGRGRTITSALKDYFSQIAGKHMVKDAASPSRQEILTMPFLVIEEQIYGV